MAPSYKYLLKIGDDMVTDTSAPLSCVGLTAYGAVKNSGLKPDDNVVVVGTGGLGLMALQLAIKYSISIPGYSWECKLSF
ncbi:MAG: hypothetical protein WA364_12430 [Candidatus Nitrosopolaris sp.]